MDDKTTTKLLVATEAENTRIAVINTNIGYIQKDILEIKLSLKDAYATKEALVQVAKDTETRLTRLESASSLWRWVSPTLAAVMGSIMTFLLVQYIMSLR